MASRIGNISGPEILQQPVGGDRLARVDEEAGKQNPLTGRSEVNLYPVPENLKGPRILTSIYEAPIGSRIRRFSVRR